MRLPPLWANYLLTKERLLITGLKMRKKLLVVSVFFLAALISTVTIGPAQADIQSVNWVGTVYKGYDSFYGTYVYAYETGSTAQLFVSVYNDYYVGWPIYDYLQVNVSAVTVWLDWGVNYTSTECSETNPKALLPYETYTFTIDFTVPSTGTASNWVPHSYRVYVEHVNSTTGPKGLVDTWTYTSYSYRFAVYAAEQADAQETSQKLSALFASPPTLTSSEANTLWSEAALKRSEGSMYMTQGDFTMANSSFQTALSLINQAMSVEKSRGTALEDSQMNSYNAALTRAYGWVLIGFGAIAFGAGVILFAVRKPKFP